MDQELEGSVRARERESKLFSLWGGPCADDDGGGGGSRTCPRLFVKESMEGIVRHNMAEIEIPRRIAMDQGRELRAFPSGNWTTRRGWACPQVQQTLDVLSLFVERGWQTPGEGSTGEGRGHVNSVEVKN
jgi:hypothetical protein